MRRSLALAVLFLLVGAKTRAVRMPPLPKPLSITRSFEITDKSIVEVFTLDRVLTQLIERSGVNDQTSDQLIRQMFDTQNPRPGLLDANGPHCDDPLINGFPRRCPTPEGVLASRANLVGEFFAMGLMNRFDQAPPDGSNCGQYRLVFGHRDADTAASTLVRRHLIFEAVLPNPNPALGLSACRPIAQFWADLSSIDAMEERRARLEKFFFEGIDGFPPVIDVANFNGAGGVRTLQQSTSDLTVLSSRFYQFRLVNDRGVLRFVPDVLENMPFGLLFDPRDDSPKARALRDEFLRQIPDLAVEDVNLLKMQIPPEYLMVESDPIDDRAASLFALAVDRAANTNEGMAFNGQMQTELARAGSHITTSELLNRAEETTCVGCHGFNGAVDFGGAVKLVVGFQGNPMISEDNLADGEGGPKSRYGIDPIIEKQFAPHRLMIMDEFLKHGTAPVHSQ